MEFECEWICVIDVITLFLILVSEIIMTEFELDDVLKKCYQVCKDE